MIATCSACGARGHGVAGKLENDGLISYSRVLITVLNRPGLEKRSCECYPGGEERDRTPAARLRLGSCTGFFLLAFLLCAAAHVSRQAEHSFRVEDRNQHLGDDPELPRSAPRSDTR